MNQEKPVLYAHRAKEDGTLDSICLACLTTISSRNSLAELEREEEDHVCKFAFPSRRANARTLSSPHMRRQSDREWKTMLER